MTIDTLDQLAAVNPVVDLPATVPVEEMLGMATASDQMGEPRVRLRSYRRTKPLAAGLLASIGAAIAVVLLSAGTGSSAYAVSTHSDGTVTLTMTELVGISDANTALAKLGVRATVVKIEPGCTASVDKVPLPPELVAKIAYPEKQGLTIQPRLIPPGDSLLLTAQRVGEGVALSGGLY